MGVIGLVLAFNIQWAEEYYLSFEGIQTYTMIPGIIVYILALVFGFIAVQRGVATALAVVGVSTVSVSGDKAFVLVLTGAAAIGSFCHTKRWHSFSQCQFNRCEFSKSRT
jgi:hypothetical protein